MDAAGSNPAHPLGELLTHAAWLRRLAGALVRDDAAAEDVVQETLVAAWQHPPASDGHKADDPRPWLAEVARNQAHDQRRSEQRRQARQQEAVALDPTAAPSAEQLIGDLQIHRIVAEVVSALDEPYRQTVILRYYEGLSAADVARRLGVPAGTVRWRLKEGLDRVRVQLDARHGGERRRWVAALMPLASVELPPVPGAAAGPQGRPPVAAARMASMKSPALAVALLGGIAATGLAGWLVYRSPASPPPPASERSTTEPAGRPDPGAPAPRRPRRIDLPRLRAVPSAVRAVAAPVKPGDPDSLMYRLLTTAATNDYEGFLEYGGDQFKAVISPDTLREVSSHLGPLQDRAFAAEPLGTIRKEAGLVHLWKIEVPGHPDDDLLVQLVIEDDKVAGFLIQ